jgi:hypothetical protein
MRVDTWTGNELGPSSPDRLSTKFTVEMARCLLPLIRDGRPAPGIEALSGGSLSRASMHVPAGGKSMFIDFARTCSSLNPASSISCLKWQITNRGTGAKIAGDCCYSGNRQVNSIPAGDYTLELSGDQDSYGTYTLKATYVLP